MFFLIKAYAILFVIDLANNDRDSPISKLVNLLVTLPFLIYAFLYHSYLGIRSFYNKIWHR